MRLDCFFPIFKSVIWLKISQRKLIRILLFLNNQCEPIKWELLSKPSENQSQSWCSQFIWNFSVHSHQLHKEEFIFAYEVIFWLRMTSSDKYWTIWVKGTLCTSSSPAAAAVVKWGRCLWRCCTVIWKYFGFLLCLLQDLDTWPFICQPHLDAWDLTVMTWNNGHTRTQERERERDQTPGFSCSPSSSTNRRPLDWILNHCDDQRSLLEA